MLCNNIIGGLISGMYGTLIIVPVLLGKIFNKP